ncbi:hypothetical protein [Sporohalobacter salinus]|uniref:hypothetical protein n=1 Tax=Sporohalobacter salinus TaxID=1494606 RepID=UPI0019615CD3|nr:hypothetical protein [Sporohalobacter salinus]MBM7623127.1 hypothetical protein [Sporohalobacter salinus]
MNLSIWKLLFYIIFENFLLIYVGLGSIDIKLSIEKYIQIITIYTLCVILIRNILDLYGYHIAILCFLLIVLFKFFVDISWSLATIASMLGFIFLLLGEILFFPIIFHYTNIFDNIHELINSNNLIWVSIAFYLSKLPLIISGISIYYLDISFFKSESLNRIFNSVGDKNEMGK